MSRVIVIQDVSKSYTVQRTRTRALQGVSLEIRPGELSLITGPSGCGKSTLLATISSLTVPDSGIITALETTLTGATYEQRDAFRLNHCGFVFQECNLLPALTAFEQVQIPLDYLGVLEDEALLRAMRAIDRVGLSVRAHLRPAELSGGERQRVAIARAIVKNPAILFADEPTDALDGSDGEAVVVLLVKIARETGAAVVCVSHDPMLIAQADRVVQMEEGRVVGDGRPGVSMRKGRGIQDRQ